MPPGAFERAPGKKWFYPQFNMHYIAVILKHADVITGHFLAHQHCDSFKIFYDNKGKKTMTGLINDITQSECHVTDTIFMSILSRKNVLALYV